MLPALPSLTFQPRFYTGREARFYLPLLYDLTALRKPRRIVTLGFGDAQVHFTICQAVREQRVEGQVLTVRRAVSGEKSENDAEWQQAKADSDEFYQEIATLVSGAQTERAAEWDLADVDFLFLDGSDSSEKIAAELRAWQPRLAPDALVLMHGLALERAGHSPRLAWEEFAKGKATAEFPDGIGLGLTALSPPAEGEDLLARIFSGEESRAELDLLYRAVIARVDFQARAVEAERANASLKLRQVWLDTLLADRGHAQEVMDYHAREIEAQTRELETRAHALESRDRDLANLQEHIAKLNAQIVHRQTQLAGLSAHLALSQEALEEKGAAFATLHQDRVKAQLIMDAQSEQLKHWIGANEAVAAEKEKLKAKVAEQKRLIQAAKGACRRRGRCFQVPSAEPKQQRTIAEKIVRELRRIPASLTPAPPPPPPPRALAPQKTETTVRAAEAPDRYTDWIAQHEPDAAGLDLQRKTAAEMTGGPKLSLLLPTYDTPEPFVVALAASLAAQTYTNFEVCVADGGSNSETVALLRQWQENEPRLQIEFLRTNLGIAENTNRCLALASGEFFACIDHDDLLPPFALFELARAVVENPGADVFYSDEDRVTVDGRRHSPFFKPEWSPEFLLSSMYLGHLTAYRRELVERVGEFRREFDLSQDYDFALRATEQARAVCHIPHVLYHWREHSASGSTGGKPDARKSNLAALGEAMRRRGLPADILEYPTANRARLKIASWPRVSIIIPTDSAERARLAVEQLPRMTTYRDYEVVLVTNSALANLLEVTAPPEPAFQFVRYDEPFNFSAKCNRGAQVATGERLIFFNDDVESTQPDWIENLIEPLQNPEVGAVAPKLLYSSGKIQHAGLVTGVRGLVGTACHQWPGDSSDYTNLAQVMRDVSALSGACLALRRDDFFRVGEWDEVDAPIAHSDLDLCFKIRAAGLRCVYTPFVTMTHRGHESIGPAERETKVPAREKASVFLLARWPQYTCHDPYFPDRMRDWIYADSPTPIRMSAPRKPTSAGGQGDLLIVSHDLSWSGAPLILWQAAKWCREHGFFVTAMSPLDGPLRAKFADSGIPVIVDPLITSGHESFTDFARQFDCVVASTIFGAPIVRAAKAKGIPHLWWIHEGRVAEHYLREDAGMRAALALADMIVTPDTRSSQIYQPFTTKPIRLLSYGIEDPRLGISLVPPQTGLRLRFLVLGTIEQRKGQEILLEALRQLPGSMQDRVLFEIVGRPHDLPLTQQIKAFAAEHAYLTYRESVRHEEALQLIAETDIMVSASHDETGPIILIEALALGKPILSTNVGAVAEKLASEDGGLFVPAGDAAALAAAIERLVLEPELRERLARNARAGFEKHFTYDRFGEDFAALVREVLSSVSL